MSNNSLLIIVPAWNEEDSLPELLRELTALSDLEADVLVVDDGSVDSTADIALSCGVALVRLPINLGVGGAVRTGYRYAVDKNYSWAVQVDADGQHNPADIPRLMERMQETNADIVIGARFAGVGDYQVRGPRAWAMKFLSKILSRQCGTVLTDTTSGFKLMNQRAFRYFAENMPSEYLGDTIEALVLASKASLHVEQVGVEMRQRLSGTPSHGAWKSAIFLLRATVSLLLAMLRSPSQIRDSSSQAVRLSGEE